ncbi:hypothetical protein NLU13_6275 [Sarocladium strictum]|uniref:Uncharacterized protein n=1 Tax=Sarocladium strictum TaxID=5046 RepID=A0AA39GFL0_SARSR|nr:hypothetical protein NLU13_6275 [Sarocladium strictum]
MAKTRSSARLTSSKAPPATKAITPKKTTSPAPSSATTTTTAADGLPIIHFPSAADFSSWLSDNHATSSGLFLRIAKKGSNIPSATYDSALAWGWIDGQRRTCPDDPDRFFTQRFTRRRKGSLWSRRNVEKVDRLTAEGRMMDGGLREVERAKADGRWERAYAGQRTMEVPRDLGEALHANKKAKDVFESLDKGGRYALLLRLETARKTETRGSRVEKLVDMLAEGRAGVTKQRV